MGLGLGMAYSDGSQLIRNFHDSILENALARYNSESSINDEMNFNTNLTALNSDPNPKINAK